MAMVHQMYKLSGGPNPAHKCGECGYFVQDPLDKKHFICTRQDDDSIFFDGDRMACKWFSEERNDAVMRIEKSEANKSDDIVIDPEFSQLMPPLSEEEYLGLEADVMKNGCDTALDVWECDGKKILIDGHNRYHICTEHNIEFHTNSIEFSDREDVITWIILRQFNRRNLPTHERGRLALRLKPAIAKKVKEKERVRKTTCQKSDKSHDTKKELAKIANVSHDTIAKIEKIENEAPEAVVNASRKGDISINAAYEVTKLPKEEQKQLAKKLDEIDQSRSKADANKEGGEREKTTAKKTAVAEAVKRSKAQARPDSLTQRPKEETSDSRKGGLSQDASQEQKQPGNQSEKMKILGFDVLRQIRMICRDMQKLAEYIETNNIVFSELEEVFSEEERDAVATARRRLREAFENLNI